MTVRNRTNTPKNFQQQLPLRKVQVSDDVATDIRQLQEERKSIKQCLEVCAAAAEYLSSKSQMMAEDETYPAKHRPRPIGPGPINPEHIYHKETNVQMNVFENVLAAPGSQQIITTESASISAKRVTAGPRAVQCLGQIPFTTLEQLTEGRLVESLQIDHSIQK
ncbi:hypothetical protein BKA65DRAFT_564461 [Rhexocercosporidium sp. MPI-PUGE-AT-0058]|nr:hypothetical protein BKA65DRAFT_564461 [Rhexocercosporidium sp. MPI-PUGE-AT-0058]